MCPPSKPTSHLVGGPVEGYNHQIAESSIDTMFFGNVFGAPGIDIDHLNSLRRQRIDTWLDRCDAGSENFDQSAQWQHPEPVTVHDLVTLPALLRVARHALREATGQLIILETLTPYTDDTTDILLAAAGFAVSRRIKPTEPDWQDAVAPYCWMSAIEVPKRAPRSWEIQNFIIFAHKQHASVVGEEGLEPSIR